MARRVWDYAHEVPLTAEQKIEQQKYFDAEQLAAQQAAQREAAREARQAVKTAECETDKQKMIDMIDSEKSTIKGCDFLDSPVGFKVCAQRKELEEERKAANSHDCTKD